MATETLIQALMCGEIIRAIDRKILPTKLYCTSESRTIRKDDCLWIALYFETAE
jgi:hypothetical protein